GNSGGGSTNTTPSPYAAAGSSSGFGWNNTTICGGNAFSTCASVAVSAVWDGSGNVTVTMQVTNLSGQNGTFANTVFTQVGLWNVPAGTAYGPNSTVLSQGNSLSGWQPGNSGLSGAGIQKDVRGMDPTNGINGGIASGNKYTFTFTITNWQGSAPDFNTLGFAIHGQGGPNGCSTKLVIQADGSANSPDPNDPAVQACGTTVTPEPVTMSLLATGLAGMGGAGLVRRRRKQADA
ncbi:MAG: PEP-CTERM sorting domain-containing protein, partial [Gemmatimonadota bacterium]|nr:PEP-CTERM sorting domain-containing protein [Gemmatimonadota bacterium]